jgi:cytoskeletal protein CcmA (bactofilin family)
LEAVQGWLTNKGADAGALIRAFELNGKKPLLMISNSNKVDLLGGIQSNKKQEFKVYLMGVETPSSGPYKMKFMSIGTARDGSKHSQVGIFGVEGLYRIALKPLPTSTSTGGGGRVPAYFGKIGEGTQGTIESAYITGDVPASQGFSSTGDILVTGNVVGSSGMRIGCPKGKDQQFGDYEKEFPNRNAYETAVALEKIGNFYVKGKYEAENVIFCGDAYMGGDADFKYGSVEIWGNLYVEGKLTSKNNLKIYGNATVVGDIELGGTIDIKGNLLTRNTRIDMRDVNGLTITGDICWHGTTCNVYSGTNRCPTITGKNKCTSTSPNDDKGVTGGNPLKYLGDQILGSAGNYYVPDPIMLGQESEWLNSALPTSGCSDLRSTAFVNNNNTGPANSIIGLNTNTNVSNLMNAINNCYKNSAGNWKGADGSKWLVLKLDWGQVNNFQGQIFGNGIANGGNFIIIVTNKPGETRLPLTTKETSVLLYYMQGTSATMNIEKPVTGFSRNYFIYSKGNMSEINGSQYLTGNLFMADGASVGKMQDFSIDVNESLFNAISAAGVIKEKRCETNPTASGCPGDPSGGGSEEGTIIGGTPEHSLDDPSMSYVPAMQHLKVKLQSQYAGEETLNNPDSAQQAILVMPRVIYLPLPTTSPVNREKKELSTHINVLSLNGANPISPDATRDNKQTAIENLMQPNCDIILKSSTPGIYACTIIDTNCKSSKEIDKNLCKNAFYVVMGTKATPVTPTDPDPPIDIPSSSSQSSSSQQSSSSLNPNLTVALECYADISVAEGSKASDAGITALCRYSDGTISVPDASTFVFSGIGANANSLARGNYTPTVKATCGDKEVSSVSCGYLKVVGIDCSSWTGSYVKGKAIRGPVVTCSDGLTAGKDNAKFTSDKSGTKIVVVSDVSTLTSAEKGTITPNVRGWQSNSGFAYFAEGPTGVHNITISDVTCEGNGIEVANLSKSCGTFTISEPTCSAKSGTYSAYEPISVTATCEGSEPVKNTIFNKDISDIINSATTWTSANEWTSTGDWRNNGYGGIFKTTGNNKTIKLNSGECWGRPIVLSSAVTCSGTVNITSDSPSYSCEYKPEWCNYIPQDKVVAGRQYYYPSANVDAESSNGFNVGTGGLCIFTNTLDSNYSSNNKNKVGIFRLANNSTYTANYSLADGTGNVVTSAYSYYKVNGVMLGGNGSSRTGIFLSTGNNIQNQNGRCGRRDYTSDNMDRQWQQYYCQNDIKNKAMNEADGGYYIYIAPGWAGDVEIAAGTPTCGAPPPACTPVSYVSDEIYRIPGSAAATAGSCFTHTCVGTLQAWYYGNTAKNINVSGCGSNNYLTGAGNNTSNPVYNNICQTNGNIQITVVESIASAGSYINLKCVNSTTPSSSSSVPSSSSAAACAYQASWCNSVYANASAVPTTPVPSVNASTSTQRCVFLTNITGEFNIGNAKVNGADCQYHHPTNSPCPAISAGPKDGGYYVYIPANGYVSALTATGGTSPNCTGGGTPSSSSNVTASCKLVDRNNTDVSSLTVTQGENIKAPKITCSNGTASNINFSTSGTAGLPQNAASNWPSNGVAYYTSSQGPSASPHYAISANFTCGGTTSFSNITCGTITVQKPTCSVADYNLTLPSSGCINNVQRPNPLCGNASSSEPKFEINGSTSGLTGANEWNGTGTGQNFCSARSKQEIRMYEVKCDNNSLTYSGTDKILCGYITINSAPSSSSGGGGTCGSGSTFGNNGNPNAGDCLNLTQGCTTSNNLPLKIYNDNNNSSTLNGTIYCSDGSSKAISCIQGTQLCEANACSAGTNGAWLSVASKTGSPNIRSNCY